MTNVIKDEEYLSKKRAIELWDSHEILKLQSGTLKGLCDIHRILFQDVFEFAGQLRTVNISKGNFRFASVLFLQSNLEIIEKMPETNLKEIIAKYVEMNIAHPFQEGNGRATRIWLDNILRVRLRKCVDWSKVDKVLYLQAMERSVVNDLEIYTLIKEALTDKVYDRQVYMRGIQESYKYENLNKYDIEKIDWELFQDQSEEEFEKDLSEPDDPEL